MHKCGKGDEIQKHAVEVRMTSNLPRQLNFRIDLFKFNAKLLYRSELIFLLFVACKRMHARIAPSYLDVAKKSNIITVKLIVDCVIQSINMGHIKEKIDNSLKRYTQMLMPSAMSRICI